MFIAVLDKPPQSCVSSPLLSFGHKALVVSGLATSLCPLDLVVLPLEAPILFLNGHGLFNEVLGPILLFDSRAVKLRWTFDDSARLRECWDFTPASVFLVVSVGIEDRAHLDELEITLELRSQVGLGQVKPVRASRGLIVLVSSVEEMHRFEQSKRTIGGRVRVTMNIKLS